MKYFLSLFILFLTVHLMGQPYLNETSLWKQYFRYGVYPPGVAFIEDIVIRLDGETTIDGTTYFKVLKTGFDTTDYLQGGGTDTYGTIYEYLDPIREANQAIYAYNRLTHEEYLLYDFNLEIGDTLKTGYCERDSVISIDTLYLGNVPRRQFHLPSPSPGDISTLVEGVGSTFGFPWQVCNVIPNPLVFLQCFCQDGSCIDFYDIVDYDCSRLLVADEVIKKGVLSIRPNPFTDEFEIYLPDAFFHNASITIVNLMGAVVYETLLSTNESVERIALPDLAAGIYIVTVSHALGITSQKMMKL